MLKRTYDDTKQFTEFHIAQGQLSNSDLIVTRLLETLKAADIKVYWIIDQDPAKIEVVFTSESDQWNFYNRIDDTFSDQELVNFFGLPSKTTLEQASQTLGIMTELISAPT